MQPDLRDERIERLVVQLTKLTRDQCDKICGPIEDEEKQRICYEICRDQVLKFLKMALENG